MHFKNRLLLFLKAKRQQKLTKKLQKKTNEDKNRVGGGSPKDTSQFYGSDNAQITIYERTC